jgi:hypothetical protein
MTNIVEIAKAARSALKRAFPKSKISVTSSSEINVRWTDDGPTLEQVKEALLKAGYAEAHAAWNDKQYLKAPGGNPSYWFDRYNAAERTAEQQDRERRQQEYEAQRRRENEAVAIAARVKASALKPIQWQQSLPVQDPAAFEAFEKLRQRAESDVTSDAGRSRRPTWAPPLILGEELGEACYTLGYLADDDKWIGRLWATFASPKRSGRYLREHVSSLPLEGMNCRGFQLHAGEARGPVHAILFEAQREESGEWRFGPTWWPLQYWSSKSREWENFIREREHLLHAAPAWLSEEQRKVQIEALSQKIEAIDAEDLAKAKAHNERQALRGRVLELARQRVLDFVGAPDAQMQAAGRIWGHCCICGKELTDPISLERGIGRLSHIVDGIKRLARDGRPPEFIAMLAGMPLAFVREVLGELNAGRSS